MSFVFLVPPSYEDSQREYHRNSLSGESSDGENNFTPRYPVFEFDDEEVTQAS